MKRIFFSFFFITGIIFTIWMMLLDESDWPSVMAKRARNKRKEKEIAYYKERIEERIKSRKALHSDDQEAIRFAREKYLMKKRNEDVYYLIEEK